VTRVQPTPDITTVKPGEKVTYQAQVFGDSPPSSFTWHCDKNAGVTSTHPANTGDQAIDKQICAYPEGGKTYAPKASFEYTDKNGNTGTGECENNTGTDITVSKGLEPANLSSCSVVVGAAGADDFAKEITVGKGDSIKAAVSAAGVENGRLNGLVTWKFNDIGFPRTDQEITRTVTEFGQVRVAASVKKDSGGSVTCSPALINVKDIVKWNQ